MICLSPSLPYKDFQKQGQTQATKPTNHRVSRAGLTRRSLFFPIPTGPLQVPQVLQVVNLWSQMWVMWTQHQGFKSGQIPAPTWPSPTLSLLSLTFPLY